MVFAFSLMDMQTGARRARLTTGERGVYFERHSTGLLSTAELPRLLVTGLQPNPTRERTYRNTKTQLHMSISTWSFRRTNIERSPFETQADNHNRTATRLAKLAMDVQGHLIETTTDSSRCTEVITTNERC